jgi:hypothetical protein
MNEAGCCHAFSSTGSFLLGIPAHRDRLFVTIRATRVDRVLSL